MSSGTQAGTWYTGRVYFEDFFDNCKAPIRALGPDFDCQFVFPYLNFGGQFSVLQVVAVPRHYDGDGGDIPGEELAAAFCMAAGGIVQSAPYFWTVHSDATYTTEFKIGDTSVIQLSIIPSSQVVTDLQVLPVNSKIGPDALIQDLLVFVRRLSMALRVKAPDHPLPTQAINYLDSKGVLTSVHWRDK